MTNLFTSTRFDINQNVLTYYVNSKLKKGHSKAMYYR